MRAYNFGASGSILKKLFQVTCRDAWVINGYNFWKARPLKFGRAKNSKIRRHFWQPSTLIANLRKGSTCRILAVCLPICWHRPMLMIWVSTQSIMACASDTKLLELWCSKLDIICNTKKTVCMIFKPTSRDKYMYITDDFSCFDINGCKLNFVSQFRYLGHVCWVIIWMMMMTYEERSRIYLYVLICRLVDFTAVQLMWNDFI